MTNKLTQGLNIHDQAFNLLKFTWYTEWLSEIRNRRWFNSLEQEQKDEIIEDFNENFIKWLENIHFVSEEVKDKVMEILGK